MRTRASSGATPPDDRTPAQPATTPARRRLPMLLLVVLTLVLGGALAVAATAQTTSTDSDSTAVAAALASAVTRGQGLLEDAAGQAPLARVLADGSPGAAALVKARGFLDALAGALGDEAATVVLLDRDGTARVAHGGSAEAAAGLLPGGDRDLTRVLGLRDGTLVAASGRSGRTVILAAPVPGSGGGVVGALVVAVPASTLLGASVELPPGAVLTLGSADGAAWAAVAGAASPSSPLSRTALLVLAALALLALPLAWLAGRPPRARRSTAAAAPVATPPAAAPSPTIGLAAPGWSPSAPGVPAQRAPAFAAAAAVAAPAPVAVSAAAPVAAPAAVAAVAAAPTDASSGKRGRFGRGRKAPEPVAAPMLIDPPASVAAAAPADEAAQDALTGLGSHRGFAEELDRLMVGWERNHVPFALLLIDLDDLKITNARAGHAAGDEQLKALGRQVRGMLRFSDRAFRTGGDEVALLLPHTDAAGAVQLGQRLLAKVRGGDSGEPAFAFTAGAAAFPGPAQDRDQLTDQANAALTWGKSHGRAAVLAYDPVTHAGQTDAEKIAQATSVAQVIAEKTLRAVFQPIVDMQTGEVVGFEGLTRPSPGAPFTNPGQLFEAAEAVGRTVELDAACFETIAEGARAIPRDRVVTINLSPRTMEAADFSVSGVLAVLAAHDLEPGRVILELTERETVLDLDRLRDNLAELQRAGVRIAADDVGAGNAGLRLLSQFRFDIVKVDLSLVQEGANNDASRAVLRSLRDLAQRWGAFVIAEGIETPTQLKVVRELGLAAGQGYLIGRPGTMVDLPPVDLVGLEQGGLMLQNAPVPAASAVAHGSPA